MPTKRMDVLLNVCLPLFAGSLFYVIPHGASLLAYHLPDGLWAYAFFSCLLIIWDREMQAVWVGVAFCVAIVFEVLQSLNYISGSGDVWDVVTYSVFFIASLLLNSFFKQYNQPKPNTHA